MGRSEGKIVENEPALGRAFRHSYPHPQRHGPDTTRLRRRQSLSRRNLPNPERVKVQKQLVSKPKQPAAHTLELHMGQNAQRQSIYSMVAPSSIEAPFVCINRFIQ